MIFKKIFSYIPYAFLFPISVFAQQGDFGNIISMAGAFKTFLNVMVVVIVTVALVFFFWGLAMFILNAGSEDKRTEGKQKMLWGAIAFTVMIGIWGLVSILITAFGIGQSEPDFIPCLTPICFN